MRSINTGSIALDAAFRTTLHDRELRAINASSCSCCGGKDMVTDELEKAIRVAVATVKEEIGDSYESEAVKTRQVEADRCSVRTVLLRTQQGADPLGEIITNLGQFKYITLQGLFGVIGDNPARVHERCKMILQSWLTAEILCDLAAPLAKNPSTVANFMQKAVAIGDFTDLSKLPQHLGEFARWNQLRAYWEKFNASLRKGYNGLITALLMEKECNIAAVGMCNEIGRELDILESLPILGESILFQNQISLLDNENGEIERFTKVIDKYKTEFLRIHGGTRITKKDLNDLSEWAEQLKQHVDGHGMSILSTYAGFLRAVNAGKAASQSAAEATPDPKIPSDEEIQRQLETSIGLLEQQIATLDYLVTNAEDNAAGFVDLELSAREISAESSFDTLVKGFSRPFNRLKAQIEARMRVLEDREATVAVNEVQPLMTAEFLDSPRHGGRSPVAIAPHSVLFSLKSSAAIAPRDKMIMELCGEMRTFHVVRNMPSVSDKQNQFVLGDFHRWLKEGQIDHRDDLPSYLKGEFGIRDESVAALIKESQNKIDRLNERYPLSPEFHYGNVMKR